MNSGGEWLGGGGGGGEGGGVGNVLRKVTKSTQVILIWWHIADI